MGQEKEYKCRKLQINEEANKRSGKES